jgi:DNA repair exonuclease SbcCD ATPase subunit
MKPQALEVFKIFERTHGAAGAKVIVEYMENADTMAIEREINNKIEHLATKDDLFATREDLLREIGGVRSDLTQEIGNVRNDLTREINNVRSDLTHEINNVRNDLTQEIGKVRSEFSYKLGDTKAELIKWMFVFWISQVGATIAIIMFLKK